MVTPAQIIKRKKALKSWLKAHGQDKIARRITLAPIAGGRYRDGIRWLQHHEWPNHPTDGLAHENVLAVLFPPKPVTVGFKALRHAESVVGVKEHPAGSNDGPVVRQFQATTGAYHAPWCASFVTWAFRQSGWKQRGWNLAYVPSWVATAHAGQHGLRIIGRGEVVPGDVVCFDWERNGIADHIGICSSAVKPDGTFSTVEGNTSAGNNSNGGQVQERSRSLGDVACFIRVS